MERLQRIIQGGAGIGGPQVDSPLVDTAEQVYISSLALLKMLKHGEDGHERSISYFKSTYTASEFQLYPTQILCRSWTPKPSS